MQTELNHVEDFWKEVEERLQHADGHTATTRLDCNGLPVTGQEMEAHDLHGLDANGSAMDLTAPYFATVEHICGR
jgi:hypothetical protein